MSYSFMGTGEYLATEGFGSAGSVAAAARHRALLAAQAARAALVRSSRAAGGRTLMGFGYPGFGLDVPWADVNGHAGTANIVADKSGTCGGTASSAKGVQQILMDLGYPAGGVDGTFGKNTFAAMKAFANEHGVSYTQGSMPKADICAALATAWQQYKSGANPVDIVGAAQAAAAAATAAAQAAAAGARPAGGSTVPATTGSATPTPSTQAAAAGPLDKAKAWWAGQTKTTQYAIMGGGAVVLLGGLLLLTMGGGKAPATATAPATANRRRARKR